MEKWSLTEISQVLRLNKKKIITVTLITALLVTTILYYVYPRHYQLDTTMEIPYKHVEVESLVIRMKGEILEDVYRELNLGDYGISLPHIDRGLKIYYHHDKNKKYVYASYINADPEIVQLFLNKLNLSTLYYARDMQIEYLQDKIESLEDELIEIEEIFSDDLIAEHYETMFTKWAEFIESSRGATAYIFLEYDPLIGELYDEQKEIKSEIRSSNKEIKKLEQVTEKDLKKLFSPNYIPEYPATPNLLLMIPASLLLGFLIGIFWTLSGYCGVTGCEKKRKEST